MDDQENEEIRAAEGAEETENCEVDDVRTACFGVFASVININLTSI